MHTQYIETTLGFSSADTENVRVSFDGSDLSLTFTNWQEEAQIYSFIDVLGFKWDEQFDEVGIRDDTTYEVLESPWLKRQVELTCVNNADQYAHYKVCFNTQGVLDVLCQRATG